MTPPSAISIIKNNLEMAMAPFGRISDGEKVRRSNEWYAFWSPREPSHIWLPTPLTHNSCCGFSSSPGGTFPSSASGPALMLREHSAAQALWPARVQTNISQLLSFLRKKEFNAWD